MYSQPSPQQWQEQPFQQCQQVTQQQHEKQPDTKYATEEGEADKATEQQTAIAGECQWHWDPYAMWQMGVFIAGADTTGAQQMPQLQQEQQQMWYMLPCDPSQQCQYQYQYQDQYQYEQQQQRQQQPCRNTKQQKWQGANQYRAQYLQPCWQPPCIATDVAVHGLPKRLCNSACIEAILEQVGLEKFLMGCEIGRPCGDAVLQFASRDAADRCVQHFSRFRWDGAVVTTEIRQAAGKECTPSDDDTGSEKSESCRTPPVKPMHKQPPLSPTASTAPPSPIRKSASRWADIVSDDEDDYSDWLSTTYGGGSDHDTRSGGASTDEDA